MPKLIFTCCLLLISTTTAADSVVFVSAFKPGEEGAIYAYRFDATTGKLKLLQRTTDVENPFFLAVSPDGQFLYSIEAEEFGGAEEEFVAAYRINGRDGQLTRLNRQSARGTAS